MCPRPLTLCLLITLAAATLAAQSPTDKTPGSMQPQPAPPQLAEASTAPFEFPLLFDIGKLAPLNTQPVDIAGERDSGADSPRDVPKQRVLPLLQNESTCYTIRAYRVARENPGSDAVKPAGYSTCQRASRFQFKTAVDTREIAPR